MIDMAIRNLLLVSTVVFSAVLASASCASNSVPTHAQDRVEIEHLMWQYIQALDSHNADAFIASFTPDGQFGSGDSATKGREALKKMVLDAWRQMDEGDEGGEKRPHMYHIVTNPHIIFVDEDHARFHAYWMGVLETGEIVAVGREVNELVLHPGSDLWAQLMGPSMPETVEDSLSRPIYDIPGQPDEETIKESLRDFRRTYRNMLINWQTFRDSLGETT